VLYYKINLYSNFFLSTSITLYLHSPHLTLEKEERERERDLELASTDPIIGRWVKLFSPSLSLFLYHTCTNTHTHTQTLFISLLLPPPSLFFYPPSKSHFHFFSLFFFVPRVDQVITICFCSIINYVRLFLTSKILLYNSTILIPIFICTNRIYSSISR
jgi:hypothetical protein